MLSLTARSLRTEATHAARTVGVGGAAAAAGTIAGRAIAATSRGYVVPLGVAAGGALVAMKARGRILPYAGVGLAIGGIWSLFDRSSSFGRGGW